MMHLSNKSLRLFFVAVIVAFWMYVNRLIKWKQNNSRKRVQTSKLYMGVYEKSYFKKLY